MDWRVSTAVLLMLRVWARKCLGKLTEYSPLSHRKIELLHPIQKSLPIPLVTQQQMITIHHQLLGFVSPSLSLHSVQSVAVFHLMNLTAITELVAPTPSTQINTPSIVPICSTAHMQDFDPSLFNLNVTGDIDLFSMFDPSFDLDGFDACLEGNLNPGFPTSAPYP